MNSKALSLFILIIITSTGCDSSDTSGFKAARQHYIDGHFAQAQSQMHEVLLQKPSSALAGRAWLIMGKSAIAQGDWAAARNAFAQIERVSPNSLEAQKARFKLAEVDEFEGRMEQALAAYDQIAGQRNVMRGEAKARAERLRNPLRLSSD